MVHNVGVNLERRQWKSKNGKTHLSILLRHSYRENGKVGKRTVANLTHYPRFVWLKRTRPVTCWGSVAGSTRTISIRT